MAGNKSLHGAREAKKDEFYTQFEDIQTEVNAYIEYNPATFRDKVVLCNCDDPYESNFFKFFALNFAFFGLKRLICTCWNGSPVAQKELRLFAEEPQADGRSRVAYKAELTRDDAPEYNQFQTLADVERFLERKKPDILEGNGDFKSEECLALLREADIVATNPPFSLFREYVAKLVEYGKKFLIIGNQNAITYKEIFPLIKENKMWLGHGFNHGDAYFFTPDASRYGEGVLMKNGLVKFRNCCWFTNLEHGRRHTPLSLMTMEQNIRYSRHKDVCGVGYKRYDNYDAIDVPYTDAIPGDYDGVMGVPITFLDKYCPEQFEIVELPGTSIPGVIKNAEGRIGDKITYARILIRRIK
ncbi:MAG: adenine-specific methyltransferase EcoRI family protein [Prevotella sp.]|nr:adenine-specific methyltransferase EcoRI family protein [Prevotella sp.]